MVEEYLKRLETAQLKEVDKEKKPKAPKIKIKLNN